MKITTDKRVQYLLAVITHIFILSGFYLAGTIPLKDNGVLLNLWYQIPFLLIVGGLLIFATFLANTEYAYRDMTKNSKNPISREAFLKIWTVILFIVIIVFAGLYITKHILNIDTKSTNIMPFVSIFVFLAIFLLARRANK